MLEISGGLKKTNRETQDVNLSLSLGTALVSLPQLRPTSLKPSEPLAGSRASLTSDEASPGDWEGKVPGKGNGPCLNV